MGSIMAQSILPPVLDWHGKSEALVAAPNDPWITPIEQSGFRTTPDYKETMAWFNKLAAASPLIAMRSVGKSVEGRDIYMLVASTDTNKSPEALRNSKKPLLLVQAGIHSGEIDGKDAGMMLLRDIAFGQKKALLERVNFLFIPILSVDAHENSSPYNRPNQRGPENMGWRTNAQNLNLNRDYTKLDTKEVRAVIGVINDYDPELYMDIHVTDGADYQFDITYTGAGVQGNSPGIASWLETKFKPFVDDGLRAQGHIPGPLMFALNDRDFSKGNVAIMGGPRFSDTYGIMRHLGAILVENHSLKPYKQRVLGTYVLLERTLKLLGTEGKSLQKVTASDKDLREAQVPMAYKIPQMKNQVDFQSMSLLEFSDQTVQRPDSMLLLGMDSKIRKSAITQSEYIEWMGRPITKKIAYYKESEPIGFITRPKGYWVPASCDEVIERLKIHGIEMEVLAAPRMVEVEMYRIEDAHFENENHEPFPYEGHMQVSGKARSELRKQEYAAGSVFITTDQPLGDLAIHLLEPTSKDSFFSWGFFLNIFQRTEYIEAYVMEPLAQRMLEESPELKAEFERKLKEDQDFAKDPGAILGWFYGKTKYYDDRYLLYPVGRAL
ncbi:zinc carboxypeptidase [Dyadobacter jejuensis]|uniref:Zinc carboxypeptidase n=2 Tax=Dyadobacter jejuensis TaxID=1082580 RepID=A0A316AGK6_9BACT|nr:zinc carboxypeptidase [Dyadobacter jejuensis]